jgi:hypothetical protein
MNARLEESASRPMSNDELNLFLIAMTGIEHILDTLS